MDNSIKFTIITAVLTISALSAVVFPVLLYNPALQI